MSATSLVEGRAHVVNWGLLVQPKVRQFVRFDPALNLPESITAHANGCLYVSLTRGFILRVRRDHGIEPVAALPLPPATVATGIKVGLDGKRLFVASAPDPASSASTACHPDTAAVWRVSLADGSVQKFVTLDEHGSPTTSRSTVRGVRRCGQPVRDRLVARRTSRACRCPDGAARQVWPRSRALAPSETAPHRPPPKRSGASAGQAQHHHSRRQALTIS